MKERLCVNILENIWKIFLRRQVLKGIIAELTSVRYASKLQALQSRLGTSNAKKKLRPQLEIYKVLCTTSQMVRNDLTTEQQHCLTQRVISARKTKEIRTIAKGRGRKLKSDKFPELAATLEYVFGECDEAKGGGGLESHPRLTTDIRYIQSK